MSEADWWLCPECSSLNNLSARKCYSCRKRKPRGAVKASEVLGYYPVVSWDGKVTLVKPIAPDPPADVVAAREAEAALAVPPPPPLREPVRRSIAALTPQYPEPVRATYADAPTPQVAVPRAMPMPPVPMPLVPTVAGPSPMAPVPAVPPVPMAPGPPLAGPPLAGPPMTGPPLAGPPMTGPPVAQPPPPTGMGPGPMPPGAVPGTPPSPRPGFPGAPPRPMVPMGPGPAAPIGHALAPSEPPPPAPLAEEQWPHWRELLDGPTPQAERLRAHSEDPALADRLSGSGPVFRVDVEAPLGAAMRRGNADTPSPGFVPWPEADRLPEPDEEASEGPGPPFGSA